MSAGLPTTLIPQQALGGLLMTNANDFLMPWTAGQNLHKSTETLQHLLDGITQSFVYEFTVPTCCIRITEAIP